MKKEYYHKKAAAEQHSAAAFLAVLGACTKSFRYALFRCSGKPPRTLPPLRLNMADYRPGYHKDGRILSSDKFAIAKAAWNRTCSRSDVVCQKRIGQLFGPAGMVSQVSASMIASVSPVRSTCMISSTAQHLQMGVEVLDGNRRSESCLPKTSSGRGHCRPQFTDLGSVSATVSQAHW